MTINALEVTILYYSCSGREVTFTSIVNGEDAMDQEDYEPKPFSSLMGGFQLTVDGYKTIFSSSDFHYLVKATSFLIHSLYWIRSKTSEWFDKDDDFPNDVIVKSTGDNLIRLQNFRETEVNFSYSPKERRTLKRGDRFFDGVTIEKQVWFNQTDIALKEYFDILLRVVSPKNDDETSKVMLDYYKVWKAISNLS
jgi:hypothetical protein